MVASLNKPLLCSTLCILLSFVSTSSLLENFLNEIDPCEDTCQKTYPSHTYEKSLSTESCQRGCRLYSIIELVVEDGNLNETQQACHDNCRDAYSDKTEECSACILGCNSQRPFMDRKPMNMLEPNLDQFGMKDMMSPLLYMHDMYSNIADKARHHMSLTWSFFMKDGTGRLIVIKSQPQTIDLDSEQDFDDYSLYRGTSAGLETNIEAADNTATEMLRHSQLKSARSLGDSINLQANPSSQQELNNSDWLTCIARKTGLPRLFLCLIILLSAVAMIWLCMSAAVTAPDQKILQKLSVNGDLEYLRNFMDKKGIKKIHPQDFVEARPLPAKIRMEQI